MNSLTEKRTALTTRVAAILKAIDNRYRVEDRLRDALLRPRTPREQERLMGSPVRYANVFQSGLAFTQDPDERSGRGVPLGRTDTYLVQVWHEYRDAAEYAGSSQAEWDRVVDGDGGLIRTLAETPYLEGGGELGDPRDVSFDLVPLDSNGQILAHYMTFLIDVT